jgi:hypothetical protein
VTQQDVVVLGQEADRGGDVRIREWRTRDVEQLAAAVVAERAESRTEPFEDLAHAGQPRPRPNVRGRGRSERREVPHDHLVRLGHRLERSAEPVLHGRERGSTRLAPEAARRDLDQRQQVHRRVGELTGIVIGPSFAEERYELGSGARLLLQQPTGERLQLVDVEPGQRSTERTLAVEGSLCHRFDDRS